MREDAALAASGPGDNDSAVDEFRFSPRPNRAHEIDWRHWGEEAFEEAEKREKLVLLSISAVWCHWCHVMDETTYSDPAVIERINADFIPVRVDSDKRPDINRRYNQGGWPTTAFLTPSGQALAGLTYAPAATLLDLLAKLGVLYRNRKHEIDVQVTSEAAGQRQSVAEIAGAAGVDPETAARVMDAILAAWDRGCGGLGGEPKFPAPGACELALSRYQETNDPETRAFVVSTLDAMAKGEIFDRVEGGFFRYATARDWSAPHYEKMLSDNADLISIYLAAFAVFGRDDYAETARRALDYAMLNLLDEEQRGFYGSQDADEGYYHRDRDGRFSLAVPPVDRTIYTDTTSQMLSALVLASAVFDDPVLLSIAERSADFIWREGFLRGKGVCHYFEMPAGDARVWGQAADQVYFLRALLDIYQATENPVYLDRAIELGELMSGSYLTESGWLGEMDAGQAAWFHNDGVILGDVPPETPDIIVNGRGIRALLALDALAPARGFHQAAESVAESLASAYVGYSYFASDYALGVESLIKGLLEIRVSPAGENGERKKILREAVSLFNPRKLIRPETVEDYVPSGEEAPSPPAVVCSPGQCRPVHSAADLAEVVSSLGVVDSGNPQGPDE
jgi:uncharacterized protein YyaL (SSP411 family)